MGSARDLLLGSPKTRIKLYAAAEKAKKTISPVGMILYVACVWV